MGMMLTRLNCDVEYAENGLEAVEKCKEHASSPFSAVLMDGQMPLV